VALLCRANHYALSCSFYDLTGDRLERVDLHKTGDVRQEPVEQAEVPPSHADNGHACRLIRDALLGSCHPRGAPLPLEKIAHLCRTQRTKRVDETYPCIELRVPGQAFLDARHAKEAPPMPPRSKISRTCSKLAVFRRSASSIMSRSVGAGESARFWA
jgi:hypothetical protein